jgi:hypothetical protein
MRKPAGFWTKERIISESKNYSSLQEFRNKNKGAIKSAVTNGWYSEISDMFEKKIKPSGYWTKERCTQEAVCFYSRTEFSKKSKTAYRVCCENKWLDDVCQHMDSKRKSYGFWTFDTCLIEASKYEYKKDFREYSNGAYHKALELNWLDDICSHMKDLGNLSKRIVYCYFFDDKSVYVGLTMNPEKRHIQHTVTDLDSAVNQHIKKCSIFSYNILSDGYISADKACDLERYYIEKYETEGYNVLNRCKGGSLGGHYIIWTYDKCREEISKYQTRNDMKKNSPSCYTTIFRNKWEHLLSHLPSRKKNKEWSYKTCLQVGKTCNNRKDMSLRFGGAYNKARLNGWLDLIFT